MQWGLLAAAALGALQVLAYEPFGLWPLQPVSLALLLALLGEQGPRRAAALGLSFGLGWFAAGLWWLFISLHQFGGLPTPLAAGAVLLLAAFLGLYPAGALALYARLRPRVSVALWAPLFAACWLVAELARAQFFTGFPWIAGGYAHTVGPWAGWAPWVGVYGIGFLTAWAAAALLRPRSLTLWMPPLALALVGWALPQDFTVPTGRLQVHLLQPNVPQSHKFDPERIERQLSNLLDQIEQAPPGLVLAPESVLPVPLALMDAAAQQRIADLSRARPLLLGSFVGSNEAGWVNTMMGWQGGELRYLYGKRHLLPFGEFIPPGFEWFVRALNIPMDSQATGLHQRPWVLGGQRLRPLICYEDLFGEDLVASALAGPDAATVFVNASNLAWFGRWMVQDQHLQFSQMRALEFQRPVVRSTNTGATAWVDHRGQVQARLAPEQTGVLSVEVEGRSGATPYARWLGALGLWPLWALALLPLIGVALRERSRRAP